MSSLKCYYCSYYTDQHRYCHRCGAYSNDISTMIPVILKNDKGFVNQYNVYIYTKVNKTEVYMGADLILELEGIPLNPQNIKKKLPLYLMLS